MPDSSAFAATYLAEVCAVAQQLDPEAIERLAERLAILRPTGRLFILGVGGSAANASHAVNDFRKLCGIDAYAPTDNVAELTARTNDEGWASVFVGSLRASRLRDSDAMLILSVGGGAKGVSPCLVEAVAYAKSVGAQVFSIVGMTTGIAYRQADAAILVPQVQADHVTPHTEAFQSVILHLLVSHPLLKQQAPVW